jgi:hypothetical protein
MEKAESDLHLLLSAYTEKHDSAMITTALFIQFVVTAVQQKKTDMPGVASFIDDTKNKILQTLNELIKAGSLFIEDDSTDKLFFPSFFCGKIYNAYKHIDASVETAFPNDVSLCIYNLQKHHAKQINILDDFTDYLNTRDEKNQTEVVRLIFPDKYDSALATSSLLPQTILQISLFKLRDHLIRYDNNGFFQKKLKNYFPGKETLVLDYFNNITMQPEKSIESIISGNSFSTSFWSYLRGLVKSELQYQENLYEGRTAHDNALYQSCTIILACNNYYTTLALNERDKALTLSSIDTQMDKPPYYYTFDEIKCFKTSQGQEIYKNYTLQEIETYIKAKLKPSINGDMPLILIFRGSDKEVWYAKKSKMVDLCVRLVAEAMPLLKKSIEERWSSMLKGYYAENSMHSDVVFEELVQDLASINMPHLMPILQDPKLEFVLEEFKASGKEIFLELFHYGEPLPLHKVLGMERELILSSIRIALPLWYSIDFIVNIIGFFRHGRQRTLFFSRKLKPKKAKQDHISKNMLDIDALEKTMVPEGKSMDDELNTLVEKWNQQIGKNAQQESCETVNGIIKDNLIFVFKTLKFSRMTFSSIEDIAGSLIASNDVMKSIHDKKALRSYVILFMLKLMKTREFAPFLKKR